MSRYGAPPTSQPPQAPSLLELLKQWAVQVEYLDPQLLHLPASLVPSIESQLGHLLYCVQRAEEMKVEHGLIMQQINNLQREILDQQAQYQQSGTQLGAGDDLSIRGGPESGAVASAMSGGSELLQMNSASSLSLLLHDNGPCSNTISCLNNSISGLGPWSNGNGGGTSGWPDLGNSDNNSVNTSGGAESGAVGGGSNLLMNQQGGPQPGAGEDLSLNVGRMSIRGGPENGAVGNDSAIPSGSARASTGSRDNILVNTSDIPEFTPGTKWKGRAQMMDPIEDPTLTPGPVASSAISTAPLSASEMTLDTASSDTEAGTEATILQAADSNTPDYE